MRSITLRSWRTLPGQSAACSAASASSPIWRGAHARHAGETADEIAGEFGNVLAPLGQARRAQRHDVQAMEQIFAETAVFDVAAQIARGGGDDAHIHLHVRRRRQGGGSADRPARAGSSTASRAACRRLRRGRACRRALARTRRSCAVRPSGPSSPKISLSMRSGAIEAALMATNGPPSRGLRSCSRRATSSLPEPAGPVISTRELVCATRSIAARRLRHDG